MSSSTTTQTEQREVAPGKPRLDAFPSAPSRDTDKSSSASITSISLAVDQHLDQDQLPSDAMYTRSDTLYKRSDHTGPIPIGALIAGAGPVPPSLGAHELSRDGLLPSSPRAPSRDKRSPKRTYFDYSVSATNDLPPSYDATTNQSVSEKPSSRPPTLYSLLIHLFSRKSYPLAWELPSPSQARKSSTTSLEKEVPVTVTTTPAPPKPFIHSQPFWLTLYFFFNLSLTLYNKGVLIHFPFAYSLTAIHALFGAIGGVCLLQAGQYTPAKLSMADNLALAAFSVLYTINIAVSNLSLEMVTVPFHQVVRAATPIFTIFLSMVIFGTRSSRQKIASLVPVVAGVGLATYGDYYCTTAGLILTVLGTVLAAIKTIYTSILQSSPSLTHPAQSNPWLRFIVPPRLQLHPLDLLTRMAPLAFVECVILAYVSGELEHVREWSAHEITPWTLTVLSMNGAIAFGLNIVSFTANKKAGPLSMTVAANVKQVLSIILAVLIFDLSISFTNALGILFTLAGGAWYAAVEYEERRSRGRI
ncbi:hypothetical protein ID866_7136 [Astraeus odoratus]|nr:hypothetical protein ID866_7136 [Astraeus odoratus]